MQICPFGKSVDFRVSDVGPFFSGTCQLPRTPIYVIDENGVDIVMSCGRFWMLDRALQVVHMDQYKFGSYNYELVGHDMDKLYEPLSHN